MEFNNQNYSSMSQRHYPNQIQYNIQVRNFFYYLLIKA